MKQQGAKKAPTPASWKPGQSGNPKGRPRTGLAFAERIRERVSPDVVIDLAMAVAADETLTAERRLAALLPLVDRGYTKPPTDQNLHLSQANEASEYDYSKLTVEQLRLRVELDDLARVDSASPRLGEPRDHEEEHPLVTNQVTAEASTDGDR